MKITANGSVRWQQTFSLPGYNDHHISRGIETPGGDFYIKGISSIDDPHTSTNWFAQFNSEGSLTWAKRWSSFNEGPYILTLLSSGNILAAGITKEYANYDNSTMLVEMTPEGEVVSARKWEGSERSTLIGCAETPKGGIVCASRDKNGGDISTYLFYINPEGELGWSMVWASEFPLNVSKMFLDSNNNVVLCGSGTSSQGQWEPIKGVLETIPGNLEDITLEVATPDCSMTPGFGSVSPLDGVVEDVGSGNQDMVVIWRHITE